MGAYWIVSSKHSRDEAAEKWNSKWTVDGFLRSHRFFPSLRKTEFKKGDRCILKVFGALEFVADFRIKAEKRKDSQGDIYYEMDEVNQWDFPIHEHSLPEKYSDLLSRSTSTDIDRETFYELIGIRNFAQGLKLNFRNRIEIDMSEKKVEDILDSIADPLKREGLSILERQLAIRSGSRIDLICKDNRGDLVVVELKKRGSDATVGQLARYISYVKEKYAKPTQKTRGVILTGQVDEGLLRAARAVDFEVMLYQLSFQ